MGDLSGLRHKEVQYRLSMGKKTAIGIDLGTTYSCVGVFQHGKVEIIANDQGNRTTPSYVAFTDTERLIGDPAKNQVAINPTNTIFHAKRLIGRKFDDSTVQADMKHWPFTVVDEGGRPKLEVEYKNETKRFTPEECSSMILTKMKETAEAYLGSEAVCNPIITKLYQSAGGAGMPDMGGMPGGGMPGAGGAAPGGGSGSGPTIEEVD